ncbi:MAG: DUF1638 domain-containing protein [Acidimicrobiia bacterium]|nr:DUF1638 domain-containing protein [Acidimicrobiia bacterium]
MPAPLPPQSEADTVFVACAALGKEVRELIRKHDWNVDLRVIDAKLHMTPRKIGTAVDEKLTETAGRYDRQVVIYGHCGAADLDDVIAKHRAVRTLGPHCYEMFGGETLVDALEDQPGTFILTDFLVKVWTTLAVKGLKMDKHPELKDVFFANYTRIMYFVQEPDEALVAEAQRIADWVGLPLEIHNTGYGDLERRLVAIMNGTPQPTTSLTYDAYSPDPSLS